MRKLFVMVAVALLVTAALSCTEKVEYSDMTAVVLESRFSFDIVVDVDNSNTSYYVYATDSIIRFSGRDWQGRPLLGQPFHAHRRGAILESDKIFEGTLKPYNIIAP